MFMEVENPEASTPVIVESAKSEENVVLSNPVPSVGRFLSVPAAAVAVVRTHKSSMRTAQGPANVPWTFSISADSEAHHDRVSIGFGPAKRLSPTTAATPGGNGGRVRDCAPFSTVSSQTVIPSKLADFAAAASWGGAAPLWRSRTYSSTSLSRPDCMFPNTALSGWCATWCARMFWLRTTSASGRLLFTAAGLSLGAGARGKDCSRARPSGAGVGALVREDMACTRGVSRVRRAVYKRRVCVSVGRPVGVWVHGRGLGSALVDLANWGRYDVACMRKCTW